MGTSTPDHAGEPSTIVIDPVKLLSSFSQLPASRSATAAIQLVLSSVIQPQKTPRKRMSETDRGSKRARADERECFICDPTLRSQAKLRRHKDKHPAKEARNSHRQTPQNKQTKNGVANYNESKKWRCSVCNKILASKSNLNRHYDSVHAVMAAPLKVCKVGERSGLRSRTPCIERKEVREDVESIMFVCECTVATESIDCAFEHAQLHLLEGYEPILQTCDDCKFTFEEEFFTAHLQNHNNNEKQPVSYIPSKLLQTEWSDMFPDLSEAHISKIKSSSIYEHTRKVKMNCDHDNGIPLYLCDTCEMYICPNEVEDHCKEDNACAKSQCSDHFCSDCEIFFYTSEALREHEKEHEAGVGVDSFRTVTFNCKWDLPLNKALRQLQKTSRTGENSRGDETSFPVEVPPIESQQCNKKNKGIEIISVSQLCCGKFIPLSELEAHTATHAVYNRTEEKKEIIEEVSRKQNGVFPDNKIPKVSLGQRCDISDSTEKNPDDNSSQRTFEVVKSTEDTINQQNNNYSRLLLSKATLEEAHLKRESINESISEITISPSKVPKITELHNHFSEEMENELRRELQKLIRENNSTLFDGNTTDISSDLESFVGNKELYQRCEGTVNIEDNLIEATQNTNDLNKIQDYSSACHVLNTIQNASEIGICVDKKEFNQGTKNIENIFLEETQDTNVVNKIPDINSALRALNTTEKGSYVYKKEPNQICKNFEDILTVETQNTNELNETEDIKEDAEMLPETQKETTAIPEELCDSRIKDESDESEIKNEIEASNPRPSSRYILSKMLLGNACESDLSDAIEKAKNDEKRRKSEHQSFIEEARRIRNIMFSRD